MFGPSTACLFLASAMISFCNAYTVSVHDLGTMIGRDAGYKDVAQFLGIPYGKAPVGELRWQPPQAYGSWSNVLNATQFGNACMQAEVPPEFGPGLQEPIHEDCLFLNIAAPVQTLGLPRRLPVLFWMHGGAYVGGSGAAFPLDAPVSTSALALVSVSVNYRLGLWGFLASSEIQSSTADGSAGNFGFQDQRLAMRWVKDHIDAFGGDGADVTIFGQSAGANSVMFHLAAPASFSEQLYAKAIIESGTWTDGAFNMATGPNDAETTYSKVLKQTGCGDLKCLRSKKAEELPMDWFPQGGVVDGVEITASPGEMIAQGLHNKAVPVIIGSNREDIPFLPDPRNTTEEEFDSRWIQEFSEEELRQVKELYDQSVHPYPADLGDYSPWWWSSVHVASESVPGFGHCGVRRMARRLQEGGSPAVYVYAFARAVQSDIPAWAVGHPAEGPGNDIVYHGSEIRFVFGDVGSCGLHSEVELAGEMGAYWAAFATTGTPASPLLPQWPEYFRGSDEVMLFEDSHSHGGIRVVKGLRKDACDFREGIAVMKAAPLFV